MKSIIMPLPLFNHETTNSHQTTITNSRVKKLSYAYLGKSLKKIAGNLEVSRTNFTSTNLIQHQVDFAFLMKEEKFQKHHIGFFKVLEKSLFRNGEKPTK